VSSSVVCISGAAVARVGMDAGGGSSTTSMAGGSSGWSRRNSAGMSGPMMAARSCFGSSGVGCGVCGICDATGLPEEVGAGMTGGCASTSSSSSKMALKRSMDGRGLNASSSAADTSTGASVAPGAVAGADAVVAAGGVGAVDMGWPTSAGWAAVVDDETKESGSVAAAAVAEACAAMRCAPASPPLPGARGATLNRLHSSLAGSQGTLVRNGLARAARPAPASTVSLAC